MTQPAYPNPTLAARIQGRCIEDGDCLIWQGPVTEHGMPYMHHGHSNKAMVRRVLFAALYGEVPAGKLVTPTCLDKRCMAKKHLEAMTPKESKALHAEKGAYSNPSRSRKTAMTMRAKSDITQEVVDTIRGAPTAKDAHERTGVSLPYCYQVRNGERRADLGNPFAGLGARP
jgi:hypothetical protein